jgi:hypothetical protein
MAFVLCLIHFRLCQCLQFSRCFSSSTLQIRKAQATVQESFIFQVTSSSRNQRVAPTKKRPSHLPQQGRNIVWYCDSNLSNEKGSWGLGWNTARFRVVRSVTVTVYIVWRAIIPSFSLICLLFVMLHQPVCTSSKKDRAIKSFNGMPCLSPFQSMSLICRNNC